MLLHVLFNKLNSISVNNNQTISKHIDAIHNTSQLVWLSKVIKNDLVAIRYLADNGYVID